MKVSLLIIGVTFLSFVFGPPCVGETGDQKGRIYVSEFENRSSYKEKKNDLRKTFTCLMAKDLKERGLQIKENKEKCDYLLKGEILLFSLEKTSEIIPFVNRWREVVTASVKVRITLTELKDKSLLLNTKEFTELSEKGEEHVEFNVGKEANGSEGKGAVIYLGADFEETLLGKCILKTVDKLADKIARKISGERKEENEIRRPPTE